MPAKKPRSPSKEDEQPKKPRAKSAKPRRSWKWRLVRFFLILGCWMGVALAVVCGYYAHDLPDISQLGKTEKRPAIVLKSQDGVIIANFGDLYGDYLPFDTLPKHLIHALLATEDRRFFEHFGIDPMGMARAALHNYQAGRVVEGGSTLTQQLAKNLFLSPERNLKRKIQEAMLALWLEYRFTKEEIITLYLNRVYLGSGAFGVDAAAKRYFHKTADKLSLMESAMLVGLLKAPSRFSPTNNPKLAKARARQVLLNMQDAGYLDADTTEAAGTLSAKVVSYREGSMGSYYFADWIFEHLEEYVGGVQEDVEIITTLDSKMQRYAEESVEAVMLENGEKQHATQAAMVSLSPDGAIRAMVGGLNYRASQYNRVTQAKRQPGSSFKLFAYLAALEAGAHPSDIWVDEPVTIGKWTPSNYGNSYRGEVTLEQAFAHSINTVAVQVAEWAGRSRMIAMARNLGISSPLEDVPSLTLGSNEVTVLEMAGAYAVLANQGYYVRPYGVEEVRLVGSGRVIYRHVPEQGAQLLSSSVVQSMYSMMAAVTQYGTGRGAAFDGRTVAGKTGTSQDYRDAWFMGYTNSLMTGVWVGNDDNSSMKHVTGGSIPTRIWRQFMSAAHQSPLPDFMKVAPLPEPVAPSLLPWQQPAYHPAQGAGEGPAALPEGTVPGDAFPSEENTRSFWDIIRTPLGGQTEAGANEAAPPAPAAPDSTVPPGSEPAPAQDLDRSIENQLNQFIDTLEVEHDYPSERQ